MSKIYGRNLKIFKEEIKKHTKIYYIIKIYKKGNKIKNIFDSLQFKLIFLNIIYIF